MTRRSRHPLAGLLLSVLATLLLVPFLGVTAQADPSDPGDPVGPVIPPVTATPSPTPTPGTPREVAEEALETVEEMVDPAAGSTLTDEPGVHGEHTDLTVALRDLALNRKHLPKSKRAAAGRLLARPDGDGAACDPNYACYGNRPTTARCGDLVCVQYVTSGAHRASSSYVALVLSTMERVASRYTKAGYRAPLADGTSGGNAKFDVYLADLGGKGLYGYCNTDADRPQAHTTAPAYCVLDNDYRAGQFGKNKTPKQNLRVTAAHEYFHAVQFAYDVAEDAWFMEATATWAEDELFDGINDNRWYLQHGPMGTPHRSVDTVSGGPEYGAWIFIRFLSERFRASAGSLPVIVRQMWEKAAHAGPGARSMYSLQAIESALADRGTRLPTQFASFTAWNRRPAAYYDEGRAYDAAPLRSSFAISPGRRSKSLTFRLDHLAAKHLRYVPTKLKGAWKLRMRFNLISQAKGGFALVTVKPKGRAPYLRKVRLNKKGNGLVTHRFGGGIAWVEVAAVNASSRYRCGFEGLGWAYTCSGLPKDDNARQKLIVRAVRG